MKHNLRLASEAGDDFPYDPSSQPFLLVRPETGLVGQFRTKEEARGAIEAARTGRAFIIAGWVGRWRTDMFLVDDLALFEWHLMTSLQQSKLDRAKFMAERRVAHG